VNESQRRSELEGLSPDPLDQEEIKTNGTPVSDHAGKTASQK